MKRANCSFCGGKVVEENIDTEFWWREKLVAFEDVPAGVCEKCGEQYFNADVCPISSHSEDKIVHFPKRIAF